MIYAVCKHCSLSRVHLSHSCTFSNSTGNVLECTSIWSMHTCILRSKQEKKLTVESKWRCCWKTGLKWQALEYNVSSVSDIECTYGFFLGICLPSRVWKKNAEIILIATSHTAHVCVCVKALVRICNTHLAYSPVDSDAHKNINQLTTFRLLCSRFHSYFCVCFSLPLARVRRI